MPEPKRPLKVFLCHASADKPAVRNLYQRLVSDGVDAWLDAESLVAGQNWQVEIPKAIRESDVVIVCLSEKSINKEGYVQREIKFALDVADEKPEGTIFVIPARLEECKVPDRLSMYHWVELFEKDGYERLVRALLLRANKIDAALQIKKKWLPDISSLQKKPAEIKKPIVQEKMPVVSKVKVNNSQIGYWIGGFAILILVMGLLSSLGGESPFSVPTPTNVDFANITSSSPLSAEIKDAKGVSMALVSAGEFTMGHEWFYASNEKPEHQIYLDAFYIDKYEVTNALYKACVEAGGCTLPQNSSSNTRSSYYDNSEFDNYPVVYVDWSQSKAYCEWRGASLPTEAQWEKAARGADERTYPWGEGSDCDKANYSSCKSDDTAPVGSYENGKSPYGIYDLSGNVWEWVADWYDSNYYANSPSANPLGPTSGQYRILRGGASGTYNYYGPTSYARNKYSQEFGSFNIGFRCARDANP